MLSTIYSNVKTGLYNLYKWFPMVWSNRDDDQYWLYKTLHHKIKMMELKFRSCDIYEGQEVDIKNMRIALVLIKRIMEDDFYDSKYSELVAKLEINFDEDSMTTTVSGLNKSEERELSLLSKKAIKRRIYAHDYLWKILSKHVDRWWL